MKNSCPMIDRVERYIMLRRDLGYQMNEPNRELRKFAEYADASGHRGPLTTDIALRWVQSVSARAPRFRVRKLEMIRGLARFLSPLEPGTEVPPPSLLPGAHRRVQPHIYTSEEIAALLRAAALLDPRDGLRPKTYGTLLGLLACTGLRTREAYALDQGDVDAAAGLIRIRETKFGKSRLVPLHPSATRMLVRYSTFRDQYLRRAGSSRFFLSERGRPLNGKAAWAQFSCLRRAAGIRSDGGARAPRLYDLRHTFASRRLLEWYRQGADVHRLLDHLSTYLGHVRVAHTYWYLTAIPELMAIAAGRFERFATARPGGIS